MSTTSSASPNVPTEKWSPPLYTYPKIYGRRALYEDKTVSPEKCARTVVNGTAYPGVSWYRRALSTSLCSGHGRMAQKVILEHEASPCANFSSLDASLPYLQFISPLRLFFSQSRPKPYEQNICAEPFSLYIITSQPAFFRMVRSIRVVYFGKALPSPLRNRPLPIPNLRANQPPPPLACINNSGKDPRG